MIANIAFILPLVAAILYGVSYAVVERLMVALPLNMVFLALAFVKLALSFIVAYFYKLHYSFDFIKDTKTLSLFIIFIVCSSIAGLCTFFAIKYISATYASVGEIAYPVFTVLFVFLFFGINQLNWWTAIGGLMVLSGSAILIMGEKFYG